MSLAVKIEDNDSQSPKHTQLGFKLLQKEPYALSYFIPHSGVVNAYTLLSDGLRKTVDRREERHFFTAYLHGEASTGKSHLLRGISIKAQGLGLKAKNILTFNTGPDEKLTDDWVAAFISDFERCRSEGGIVLVAARCVPRDLTSNPHLLSRFHSGAVLSLGRPREEELRAVLRTLLERRNLLLSERSLDYLLARLPANPLCFDQISAKLDELPVQGGKAARFSAVRDIVIGDFNSDDNIAERSGRQTCLSQISAKPIRLLHVVRSCRYLSYCEGYVLSTENETSELGQ